MYEKYDSYGEANNMKKCEFSIEDHFIGTVTVGERGQIVIPAEARQLLGINPGDKLMIMRAPAHRGIVAFRIDDFREWVDSLQAGMQYLESQSVKEE